MDSLDSLNNYEIDYTIFENLNKEYLSQYNIMPLYTDTLFFKVATSDKNLNAEELITVFHIPVKLIYVPYQELQFEWKHHLFKSKLFYLALKGLQEYKDQEKNSFIEQLLDEVLEFSIENNASDIHFEVVHNSLVIRLRIDGVLKQYFRFSIELYYVLSSLIKYLGNLDISQRRKPLNARFSKKVKNKLYDLRISTMPTIVGESIVLRILDNKNAKKRLKELGFDNKILEDLEKSIVLKQGLILVTGPTGSGKTTTLYSILQELNREEKKIITVEDPVEYKIDGIMQVNLNEEIDLNYPIILKNTLRQDPDILMIGEIRDIDSLKIALQASLTGHLVIATLHTNDSIEAITRLLDLGAEPYLIEATLKVVLSQRLVRILCPNCKKKSSKGYEALGCEYCNYTGFYGRQIVAESLVVDSDIQNAIIQKRSNMQLEKLLKEKGFETLAQKGQYLIDQGVTTFYELDTKL